MRRLSTSLHSVASAMAPSEEVERKIARATHVKRLWKDAIVSIYGTSAHFILSNTNAVYIMREKESKVLIVYAQDSMVRDSLITMQECIKHELFQNGEQIDEYRVLASRYAMKQRHPFLEEFSFDMQQMEEEKQRRKLQSSKLSAAQQEHVDLISGLIEDPHIRESFAAAMTASLKAQGFRDMP